MSDVQERIHVLNVIQNISWNQHHHVNCVQVKQIVQHVQPMQINVQHAIKVSIPQEQDVRHAHLSQDVQNVHKQQQNVQNAVQLII